MKNCKVEKCDRKYHGIGYCNKHLHHLVRHGKILERTIFDKNEFRIKDNICEMDLYNIKNEVIATTIFDLKYLEEVKKYKWFLGSH